jgi:uncharacterized short protein YbdD (DUF466 family)
MTASEKLRKIVRRLMRRSWRGLREWCGDSAYETYLQSSADRIGANGPLTAKDFYLERLNRRYSQPNRCC